VSQNFPIILIAFCNTSLASIRLFLARAVCPTLGHVNGNRINNKIFPQDNLIFIY